MDWETYKKLGGEYYRWLPQSIRDEVQQEGMRPNSLTGNPMHFWDNRPNADRYGEIANDLEPHDLWATADPGELTPDPWFTETHHDWGEAPGAWRSMAQHIPPDKIWRVGGSLLAETHPKPYEAKMWTGKPNSRGILGPVRTPFWTTSHQPEALGFAGGEGMEGYVHPVQVRFKNPAHYFAGATWTPSSIEEARSAGCDGCVVHWPEDLRDPSDPMPSRTWAIALDPGTVVPGHLADSVQES